MEESIKNHLEKVLEKLVKQKIEVKVVVPESLDKGDFSSNVAMTSFKELKGKYKSPEDFANFIIQELHKDADFSSDFKEIKVVKPGFINFYLSNSFLSTKLNVLPNEQKKIDVAIKSEKVILEFGDPNPFKEPHVGHLRNFTLGESLSRLMEENNYHVIRASYQGDVGLHVAKAIWGMLNLNYKRIEAKSIEQKNEFLAKAYALGATEYEKNKKIKDEITSINNKIYQNHENILPIWKLGRDWSLKYFDSLYKLLGINYDKFYFESETAPLGVEIVKKNSPKIFQEHDDAYIFRGEPFGLHTRVFVTKDGYATYEGKDLALAALKKKDFGITKSIVMTANEQSEYFKVLLKALSLVDKGLGENTSHLSFGFVNLKDGKMSSRTGKVVGAFWLIEEAKKRLKKEFKEVGEGVLEQVAVGAVKWSMLKFSRESDIAFSFEESISIEGNSGPYVQYTYARTQSLLSKKSEAKELGDLEGQELALTRIICQFSSVKRSAALNFSPNILTNYLFQLSREFNAFYEKEKIIGSSKEEQRILLTMAVAKVLEKGLYLLGISSPKKI